MEHPITLYCETLYTNDEINNKSTHNIYMCQKYIIDKDCKCHKDPYTKIINNRSANEIIPRIKKLCRGFEECHRYRLIDHIEKIIYDLITIHQKQLHQRNILRTINKSMFECINKNFPFAKENVFEILNKNTNILRIKKCKSSRNTTYEDWLPEYEKWKLSHEMWRYNNKIWYGIGYHLIKYYPESSQLSILLEKVKTIAEPTLIEFHKRSHLESVLIPITLINSINL